MSEDLVDAMDIAVMAGAPNDRCFASNRIRKDESFPRPIIRGNGGKSRSFWRKVDVESWLAKRAQPKARAMQQAGGRLNSLDLTLALQFICARSLTVTDLNAARHVRLALNKSRQNKEPVC